MKTKDIQKLLETGGFSDCLTGEIFSAKEYSIFYIKNLITTSGWIESFR